MFKLPPAGKAASRMIPGGRVPARTRTHTTAVGRDTGRHCRRSTWPMILLEPYPRSSPHSSSAAIAADQTKCVHTAMSCASWQAFWPTLEKKKTLCWWLSHCCELTWEWNHTLTVREHREVVKYRIKFAYFLLLRLQYGQASVPYNQLWKPCLLVL
jgi:hypothetical protein